MKKEKTQKRNKIKQFKNIIKMVIKGVKSCVRDFKYQGTLTA